MSGRGTKTRGTKNTKTGAINGKTTNDATSYQKIAFEEVKRADRKRRHGLFTSSLEGDMQEDNEDEDGDDEEDDEDSKVEPENPSDINSMLADDDDGDVTEKNNGPWYMRLLRRFIAWFAFIVRVVWHTYHASKLYLLWIILHYFSANLYVRLCTPNTLVGFLSSPFVIASPQCRALRWVMFNGALTIDNMWFVLGLWLCTKILLPKIIRD
jgi:hypothetical protein